MRITFFDTETSPILCGVWGLYDQNVPYHHVIQEWFIICASWSFDGSDIIKTVSVLDDPKRFKKNHADDYHVIQKLVDMVNATDVLVAHNMKFDWGKFMARVVFHGFSPPKKPVFVDTLKEARRYKFTSNKLDDLGAHLDTGRKIKMEAGEFIKCAQGDANAIKRLIKYNRGDIPPLKALYKKLEPYSATYPNIAILKNGVLHCPNPSCTESKLESRGGRDAKKDGYYSSTRLYRRYQCQGCMKWCRETRSIMGARLKPA